MEPSALSAAQVQDETLAESARSSPAIAAPGIVLEESENPRPDLPKTKGEWFYDGLQQVGGKGAILTATAVFGFIARYGKPWYGPIPNVLKTGQDWFHSKLISNSLYTLSRDNEIARRIAAAAASTMVICHGGNIFAPIMKSMENNRENIANWYNRRWGRPEDVEIAHERLKDEPKQTWGDVAKGRLVAWSVIFSAFAAVDMAFGKGKLFGKGSANKYRFDQYEEGFGRWLAGFTKKGKELWDTPLTKELTEAQKQNKVYQFGKITALDFYATNIGIIIWSFISRFSARKRHDRQNGKGAEETAAAADAPSCPTCPTKPFAKALSPAASFSESITGEKARASAEMPVGMGV